MNRVFLVALAAGLARFASQGRQGRLPYWVLAWLGLMAWQVFAAGGGPLDNAQNRLLVPVASRSAALFHDTDGDLDIDDPNDREFIRTTVDDRVIQFANHFAATVDPAKMKASLSRLIDPGVVAAIPSSFWAAFTGLPQLPADGTWSTTDSKNLRKIRAAFMIYSLLEFGAPGKFALWEEPGAARGGVDVFATEQGTDPELLKKVKEYEDSWQRLILVRILGMMPSGPDPAVQGLVTARSMASGQANSPSEATLQQWWAAVLSGPLKPAVDVWKLNRAWWDLNPDAGRARQTAEQLEAAASGGKPPILSGAQLASTEVAAVAGLDAESLLEKLATADNWQIKANYQSFPEGVPIGGGSWMQTGTTLSYNVPGGAAPSPTRTSNVALMSLEMINKPIDLFVLDKSYQAAYGETYSSDEAGPNVPARAILRYLDRLLDAREKVATDQPQTLPDFGGGTSGTPSDSGSFSSSAGIGASL